MDHRFKNVIAHLDTHARVHASNARNPHHTMDDRQLAVYLTLEFCDAIRALGGEPSEGTHIQDVL